MRVPWLADVLRAEGLVVIEEPGWRGRGNALTGVTGVIGHHTASAQGKNCPSVRTVTFGRPDLPGPLCQVLGCRAGHVHVIADGKANHAGAGSWPGIGGNTNVLGFEFENDGVGEPWPTIQMNTYVRAVTAVFRELRLPPERFCTHYEWALPKGRKIDPRGPWVGGGDWWSGSPTVTRASADTFRARVRACLEEDEMAWTDEEKKLLLDGARASIALEKRWDASARSKVDLTFIEVIDEDHPEQTQSGTLGARVKAIKAKTDLLP